MTTFLLGLAAALTALIPLAPVLIPLSIPFLPAVLAGFLSSKIGQFVVTAALLALALALLYGWAWQRGWNAHKANELARNEAAISRANDAEQQMRLCEGAQGQWDARGRRCVR